MDPELSEVVTDTVTATFCIQKTIRAVFTSFTSDHHL